MTEWHRRAGSASKAGFDVAIGPHEAGWEHTGLFVVTLAPGESRVITGREFEWLVLPLSGQVRVESKGELLFLFGRKGPFDGTTDYAYVPVGSSFTITSMEGARIALPHARASEPLPFRRIPAEETVVELRGAVEVPDPEAMERELIAFCREHLASFKCPRSIDFVAHLPRQDNGKIAKVRLRDEYRRLADEG